MKVPLFRRSAPTPLIAEPRSSTPRSAEPSAFGLLQHSAAAADWDAAAEAVLALGEELPVVAAWLLRPGEPPAAALAIALALRDRGRLDEADRLLTALEGVDTATRKSIRLERLVLNVLWRSHTRQASELVAELTSDDLEDARAALIRAISLRRQGATLEALLSFSGIAPETLHAEEFWAETWFQFLLWRMQEGESVLASLAGSADPPAARELVVRLLALSASAALLQATGPAMASWRLRALLSLDVSAAAAVVCEAVLALPRAGAADAVAHGLAAFLSFRFDGYLQRFAARFLPDAELERHPLLLEYLASHPHIRQLPAFRALAGDLLKGTRTSLHRRVEEGRSAYAHQARKLLARDAARRGEAPPAALGALPQTLHRPHRPPGRSLHVFVGVFGQLRFPEVSLPRLQAKLSHDLAALEGIVSYGLATWTEQGRRPLGLPDPAALALARLPTSLEQALQGARYGSVEALAQDLPATVAQLRKDADADPVVTEQRLREAFGWRGGVALAQDAEFQAHDGAAIAARLGAGAQVLNQGRMWNRLEALKRLSDQACEREGLEVDIHLFIRADLNVLAGSLAEAVRQALAMEDDRDLVVDHDGWAAFIEGFGDRYMICRPGAAERLYEGRRILLETLDPGSGISPDYLREMHGHTFPATLVFEDGGTALQLFRHQVDFEIDRGRLSLDALAPSLKEDSIRSPSPRVRALLESELMEAGRG